MVQKRLKSMDSMDPSPWVLLFYYFVSFDMGRVWAKIQPGN